VKQRLRRSGTKASPKRSKGFAKAEQRLRQSRAKASPKRRSKGKSKCFTLSHWLRRSEAKASAPPKPKQSSKCKDATANKQ
jgi:hypothetical protein